jgi:uncharacterized protein (DUF342 family)
LPSFAWSANVSTDPAVALPPHASVARFDSAGPEHCIARRPDGVYADPSVLGTTLLAAVDNILRANEYFVGVDYPVLLKALFDHGPELPQSPGGEPMVRFAAGIAPFDPRRRALYRSVKISGGMAEYYFEPVFLADPDDPEGGERPARLDPDEFIADMWQKGIRFGIDVAAVRSAIESGQAGRVVVARRGEPVRGRDAHVVEVSEHLHRSDAPRQLANGKLDLMSFQNRFPQVPEGTRLLRKVPHEAGAPGFELTGIVIAPEQPKDLDLSTHAGTGTAVERTGEGEFLVARQAGFLSVDAASGKIAVDDKIVSRDGVSARTTGNLQLTGDYEEFGEVQEKRVIEGEGITVHADVFGHILSRGGAVLLNRNLVGGSAHNKAGGIRVKGVAVSAVIQAVGGDVVLERAENCVISGARVTVAHAINCEILGEQVDVGVAEGCAIGGMRVAVGSATPRRQGEMVVIAMHPDCAGIDDALAQVGQRVGQFAELVARHKEQLARLAAQPELRRYMQLATRVRKNEITLSAEQLPQFQKMGQAQAPALKEIARVSQELKAAEAEQQTGLALLAQIEGQRAASSAECSVEVRAVLGETHVRAWAYHPDGASLYDLAARDVKANLRGGLATTPLFAGSSGAFAWRNDAPVV